MARRRGVVAQKSYAKQVTQRTLTDRKPRWPNPLCIHWTQTLASQSHAASAPISPSRGPIQKSCRRRYYPLPGILLRESGNAAHMIRLMVRTAKRCCRDNDFNQSGCHVVDKARDKPLAGQRGNLPQQSNVGRNRCPWIGNRRDCSYRSFRQEIPEKVMPYGNEVGMRCREDQKRCRQARGISVIDLAKGKRKLDCCSSRARSVPVILRLTVDRGLAAPCRGRCGIPGRPPHPALAKARAASG